MLHRKDFPGSQSQGMRELIGLSHCRTFLRVFMKRCAVDIDWGSEQAGLKLLHTRLGTIAIEQRCDDESPEDRVRSILAKKLRMAMVVRRAIVGSNFHQAETPSTSLSQPIRLGGFS